MKNYTAPVNRLLSLGDARTLTRKKDQQWPDYIGELGFNEAHIDELIKMTLDPGFSSADPDSLEVWAPIHAWRSLGQLRANSAVAPLLQLLDEADPDDDWPPEELPEVFARIGEPAIEPISQYLLNSDKNEWKRAATARALTSIAERYPEHSERCCNTILDCLNDFQNNTETLNGSLIADLLDFHEKNIVDLRTRTEPIERAFQADAVDCSMAGDWEDIQIELGLLDKRITPKRNYVAEQLFGDRAAEMQALLDNFNPAYLDAPRPQPVVKSVKIGRNDLCPCGSGKKYKKCCLLKERR